MVSDMRFRCAQLLLFPDLSPFERPPWFRSVVQTQTEVPTIPESIYGAIMAPWLQMKCSPPKLK